MRLTQESSEQAADETRPLLGRAEQNSKETGTSHGTRTDRKGIVGEVAVDAGSNGIDNEDLGRNMAELNGTVDASVDHEEQMGVIAEGTNGRGAYPPTIRGISV